MKMYSAVFAVILACAMTNAGAVRAEDAQGPVLLAPGDELAPVDNVTLSSQVGQGPGTAGSMLGRDLRNDLAVILWDEAKPRGNSAAGGGIVTGQVGASISISVGGN